MSSIRIGANINSLVAQRRLTEASESLARTFERLSSGLRINRASNDPAGLAISSALNSNTRVFNQGIRNLNDAVSFFNIADGTIEQLSGIVVRIRELAQQAANGSYGSSQRKALNNEAQELREEFFRISREASFNKLRIFDGSAQELNIQAGYGTDGSLLTNVGGTLGSGYFTQRSTINHHTTDIYETTLGDVNSDGNLDLVSVGLDGGTHNIKVAIGNGDGTFATAITYASGGLTTLSDVKLDDLNGDGSLDIIASGMGGGTGSFTILLGNGSGSFATARTYSITSQTISQSIVSGDLNRDGIVDLIVSGSGASGSSNIFLGRGDGTFGASTSFSTTAPQFKIQR